MATVMGVPEKLPEEPSKQQPRGLSGSQLKPHEETHGGMWEQPRPQLAEAQKSMVISLGTSPNRWSLITEFSTVVNNIKKRLIQFSQIQIYLIPKDNLHSKIVSPYFFHIKMFILLPKDGIRAEKLFFKMSLLGKLKVGSPQSGLQFYFIFHFIDLVSTCQPKPTPE